MSEDAPINPSPEEGEKIIGDLMLTALKGEYTDIARAVYKAGGKKDVVFAITLKIKPSANDGLRAIVDTSLSGKSSGTELRASLDNKQLSFFY